jgi:hypothetical protein
VLLILGSLTVWPESTHPLLNKMPATIWLMTILSYWTFSHRLYHTWRLTREMDDPSLAAQATPQAREKQEGHHLRLEHGPV